jgi:hypothetical protein
MSRPADAEWSVVGYDQDPVPGDPEMVAEIGLDLRDMADLIERQAHEIEVVASVREWQSKAAEKFRDNARDAVKDLRKAYHRLTSPRRPWVPPPTEPGTPPNCGRHRSRPTRR